MLKQVLLFFSFFLLPVLLVAQQLDSMLPPPKDSVAIMDSLPAKDSIATRDSLNQKMTDSIQLRNDSLIIARQVNQQIRYNTVIQQLLTEHLYLNSRSTPVAMNYRVRKWLTKENFFYTLITIGALLAFLRFFYTRYFNNLFRVFFNASLRQSQLTDQLLQAKLPSLFFNIVFILTGGIYAYLLLRYYAWIPPRDFWKVLLFCTISLSLIYFGKFVTLKFTGWVTGYQPITNTYIFVIFLINKILGIILLPFAVLIAFSTPALATAAVVISLLLIGLMFLLRFFRSYGLLQHQLKISRFHFFMYVIGVEILPVLLIYKGLVLLLSKNL